MGRRRYYRPLRLRPPKRKGGRFLLFKLFVLLITLLALILFIESKLRPVVKQVALSRVTYIAGKTINDAVNDELENDASMYADMIRFEKDTEGHIAALTTDMVKINRFKATIIGRVMEKMNNLDPSQLNIPLGNIINGEVFSGRGPKIPIVIIPTGIAEARLASVFRAAGINQTRHQIIIEVTVNISILLPWIRTSTEVTSQVITAETIIVGVVPDTYTYLEDTGQTGMDIYGNFDLDGKNSGKKN